MYTSLKVVKTKSAGFTTKQKEGRGCTCSSPNNPTPHPKAPLSQGTTLHTEYSTIETVMG